MRHLLDTHALIWSLIAPERLPIAARSVLADGEVEVYASAASAMEITTKFRLGKLPEAAALVGRYEAIMGEFSFMPLPITVAHAHLAGSLDIPHKDPFDRFLIAQALADDLILVSNEALFDGFGVRRLWD